MMGWRGIRFGMVGAPLAAATVALAAAGVPDNIRLANNVVPAPFGYEAVTTQYVVAEATPLYISPFLYPGTVTKEQLKTGQAVDILAKAKPMIGFLIGKDGIGIGYIPISRLAPAKR